MLEAKNRISFSVDCLEWVRHALKSPGVSLVPLTPEISVLSTRLPGDFQGDPADRIIVATALALNASLITKDQKIIQYSESTPLKVIMI